MKKYYAGIGSRSTPLDILMTFKNTGKDFAKAGWILRSGNCKGADQAFQEGANAGIGDQTNLSEIFLPYNGYGGTNAIGEQFSLIMPHSTPEAFKIAEEHHPAWHLCRSAAKTFHARNVEIILGHDLETPVEVVFCWTKDSNRGGTAMGMRIANSRKIPVYNFYNAKDIEKFVEDREKWV